MTSISDLKGGFTRARERAKSNRARAADIRQTEVAGRLMGQAHSAIGGDSKTGKVFGRLTGVGGSDKKGLETELERKRVEELEKEHAGITATELKAKLKELDKISADDMSEDQAREVMVLAAKVKEHAKAFDRAEADMLRSTVGKADAKYMKLGDTGKNHDREREKLFAAMNAASIENSQLATKGTAATKTLDTNKDDGTLASNEEFVARRLGVQAVANLDPALLQRYIDEKLISRNTLDQIIDPRVLNSIPFNREEIEQIVNKARNDTSYQQVPEGTSSPGGGAPTPGTSPSMDRRNDDTPVIEDYRERHADTERDISFGRFLRDESGQTLAVDFDQADLKEIIPGIENMAGVFIEEGEQREKIIDALAESYEEQLRREMQDVVEGKITGVRAERSAKSEADVTRMVAEFKTVAQSKKSLRLVNKGRVGKNARHVYQHESYHEDLSNLGTEQVGQYWEQLSEADREQARQAITGEYGGDISEQMIANEFFAEALANTEMHAEDNGVVIRDQALINKIKADIIARRKGAAQPQAEIEGESSDVAGLIAAREALKTKLAERAAAGAAAAEIQSIQNEIASIDQQLLTRS